MPNPHADGRAYVLWGEHFDEVLATLFAASLRNAGWYTKLIGLRGDRHLGRRGVLIVADVALTEVQRTPRPICCLVAPCAPDELGVETDPRLAELLAQAQRDGAVFVAVGDASTGIAAWPANGLWLGPDGAGILTALHTVLNRLETMRAQATGPGNTLDPPEAGAPSREGACFFPC